MNKPCVAVGLGDKVKAVGQMVVMGLFLFAISVLFFGACIKSEAAAQCRLACGNASVRHCEVMDPVKDRVAVRVCEGDDAGTIFKVKSLKD